MKIYGKTSALDRLRSYAHTGRMPHALLITGEEGVGKRTLADYAAMLMLCERKGETPCMCCNECLRIEQHIHPDVIYPYRMGEEGKYTMKEMPGFIADLVKLPNDSDFRICIFEEADSMNPACQNALLKLIEEPSPFNRFIFTATDKKRILGTIISRVTEIKAEPMSKEECLSALAEHKIKPDKSESLYNTFGGNLGRCLSANKAKSVLASFTLAEETAILVSEKREYECLAKLSKLKTRDELTAVMRNLSDIFGNASALYSGGKPYGFCSEVCTVISKQLSVKKLMSLYDVTNDFLGSIDFNLNVKLTIAALCAKMFEIVE